MNWIFLLFTAGCIASPLADEAWNIDLSDPRFKQECPWVYRQGDVFIKRRRLDNINDVSAWQLCHLLGMENIPEAIAYCTKSYCCVIQRALPLRVGIAYLPPSPEMTKCVSLEEYWKAALLSFVLGLDDLHGANIGVTPDGKIMYFDNDGLRSYTTILFRRGAFFHSFFSTSLMDWPQYQYSIGESLGQKLQILVRQWKEKQDLILQHPLLNKYVSKHISVDYLESIVKRIDILLSFNFTPDTNFQQFYAFLYPSLARGLDDLCLIVQHKTLQKMGHGSALNYCVRNNTNPDLQNIFMQWQKKWFMEEFGQLEKL